jgi:hypothetical protein
VCNNPSLAKFAEAVGHDSGGAGIVLAVVLVAAAAAVAYAGARLPLPARLARPGRTAKIVMLAAWVLAIALLFVSVAAYLTQVYRAGLERTPAADPITPVTLIGAGVLFFVIALAQQPRGWRIALGSAVVGAAAAPMIFELPFDLIIMPRTHPVIDPGLYRLLLFGALILPERAPSGTPEPQATPPSSVWAGVM